jgi:hypothetical protein
MDFKLPSIVTLCLQLSDCWWTSGWRGWRSYMRNMHFRMDETCKSKSEINVRMLWSVQAHSYCLSRLTLTMRFVSLFLNESVYLVCWICLTVEVSHGELQNVKYMQENLIDRVIKLLKNVCFTRIIFSNNKVQLELFVLQPEWMTSRCN